MAFGQQSSGLNNSLSHCGDTEPEKAHDTCIYIERCCGTFCHLFLNYLGLNLQGSSHHKDL